MLESPESASPILTRAVAAALAGEPFDPFRFRWWEKAGLSLLAALPAALRGRVIAGQIRRSAIDPALAGRVDASALAAARLADYARTPGPFEAILIGPPLGGAAAHLGAVLAAPFLPQGFILSFAGGSEDDSVAAHVRRARGLAITIRDNNPGVLVLSHFDPVHDGWLTRQVTHVRLKLLGLPEAYRRFLRGRLRPGGSILYLDCLAQWEQYELEQRYRVQIGGWGDISAEEFRQGSPRLDAYLAAKRSTHRGGWALEDRVPSWLPESEWGSEPGLDTALEGFAKTEGYHFSRLRFTEPTDVSRLAFEAHRRRYQRSGIEPLGTVVEMFTQYDPSAALAGGLLPIWLVFNDTGSLEFLRAMKVHFPPDKPVFFSPLATFSRPPDMARWGEWMGVLGDVELNLIGARASHYPEDPAALWSWPSSLHSWAREHRVSSTPLAAQDLIQLAGGDAR